MADMILRPLVASDREAYLTLYREAFPLSERKSFDYMVTPPANDRYELLTVSTPSATVAGLVILAYATIGGENFALLDYLAISPEVRGRGIGHAVLPLVHKHCQNRRSRLFLEIEAPDPSASNAEQRVRRKAFYLSCGLRECGVKAGMYGTVMELLAYPEDRDKITLGVYQAVVKVCYPPDMGLPRPLDAPL